MGVPTMCVGKPSIFLCRAKKRKKSTNESAGVVQDTVLGANGVTCSTCLTPSTRLLYLHTLEDLYEKP